MSVPILNYVGNAGVDDMNAFNARLYQTWRGDNLFRIYAVDGKLYFIRVGGSKQRNAAMGAQLGLLGALMVYFANKRAEKKTRQTLNDISGAHPEQLLSSHKYNFMLEADQVASATILHRHWLGGATAGRWTLIDSAGRKRNLTFDDVDNMRSGIERLAEFLGQRLSVQVDWDEVKKKYRKRASA